MYNLQNSTLYRVLWFGAILKNCTSIHIFFWHKSACHQIPLDTWRADHTAHIPRRSPHIRPHRPRRPQSQQRRCCWEGQKLRQWKGGPGGIKKYRLINFAAILCLPTEAWWLYFSLPLLFNMLETLNLGVWTHTRQKYLWTGGRQAVLRPAIAALVKVHDTVTVD